MVEITEKTGFLKLTPIYILLSFFFIIVSLIQKLIGYGDYTATALYFSIPAVIVGVLFQMYPTIQNVSFRFEKITYLHLLLFLISFFLYITGRSYGIFYFLSSLLFFISLLINTKRYSGQIQLFFITGSIFYIFASYLILIGESNVFLIKHTIAVGFLMTIAFGSIYMLLPMLQLEKLAFSDYLWLHLSFHTFFTVDLLISWNRFNFQHIYISGILVLSSALLHCFIIFRTLSGGRSPLKGLDPSVKAFVLSLFLLIFSLVVGVLSAGSENFSLLKVHSEGLIYGFFTILTVGASYHIIPFMLWWRRYAPLMGKEKIPTLKELFPQEFIERTVLLLTLSLVGMVSTPFLKTFVQWFFVILYVAALLYFIGYSSLLTLRFLRG